MFLRFSARVLVPLLALGSCVQTELPNPKVEQVRAAAENCRSLAALGHYDQARLRASETLNDKSLAGVDDVGLDRLQFCYITTKTLNEIEVVSRNINDLINAISDVVNGRTEKLSVPPELAPYFPQDFKPQSPVLEGVITSVLKPFITLLETNERYLKIIIEKKRFAWHFDRLPFIVADEEIFDGKGDYDMGEVYLLYGITQSLLSTLYVIDSVNYEFNLPAVVAYAKIEGTPLKDFNAHPVLAIMNSVAMLLGTNADFLTLDATKGAKNMAKAGQGYANGVDALLDSVTFMKARTDKQANHVVEYKRVNKEDYFVIHLEFKKTVSKKVDLTKFTDTTIWLKEDVSAALARLGHSLRGEKGVRANVQNDVFPVMALVTVVLLQSGGLDAFLSDILDAIDPKLAAELQATFDISKLNQDYVLTGLLTTVPMAMELDLARIFNQPVDMRTVMPAWKQPAYSYGGAMEGFTAATFVVEYECADNPLAETSKYILCNNPADAAHFGDIGAAPWINQTEFDNFGPLWQGDVTPDGIKGVFPYIGFKDPTFNGLLYIDIDSISRVPELPSQGGMQLADQKTLNASIAEIWNVLAAIY